MSDTKKTTMLQVTARPPQGFRRAGRHWPPQPIQVPAGDFSAEQRKTLEAEPQLIVSEVEVDAAESEPAKAEGGTKSGGKAGSGTKSTGS